MTVQLSVGDCRQVMAARDAASVDSFVIDPPYGLEFMAQGWDKGVPPAEYWAHALRVAKPGAYLCAFGGTRTFHRLACAIEDAGWLMRDTLMWMYGEGFPKSLDMSKAMDADAGMQREVIGQHPRPASGSNYKVSIARASLDVTAPASDAAKEWDGYGTGLKPAWEPIVLAQKPREGTYAANVQLHGAGALNIDACRHGDGAKQWDTPRGGIWTTDRDATGELRDNPKGRWPANVLLDPVAAAMLDARVPDVEPSRFFYCAKPTRGERDAGLESLPLRRFVQGYHDNPDASPDRDGDIGLNRVKDVRNHHPTVKPIALMAWLVRLVTPSGGLVMDPFMGSGTTGCAAAAQRFRFAGCDLSAEYVRIAELRIRYWADHGLVDDAAAAITAALPGVPNPRPPAPAGHPSLFDGGHI